MPMGGGSVNYVFRLLSEFDKRSYIVLTADENKVLNRDFDLQTGIPTVRSKYIGHVLGGPWSCVGKIVNYLIGNIVCLYYILKYQPRLVYYTEISLLWCSFLIGRKLKRFKVGLFTYAEEIEIARRRKIYRWLSKNAFEKADIVLTVCDYTRDIINNIVQIDDKIVKIIPSVPMPKNNKEKAKTKEEKIKILTVARLEERKGHVDMIQAISRLIYKHPNLEYSIVGKGSYEKVIREAIKTNHLEDVVMLKGVVSDEELEEEYRNADIFAMPHKQLPDGNTEGCPTVFLEASLRYLPVVGGEAGGVSDAIVDGETGFICHVGTDELYENLERLIVNPSLRQKMGENGFKYASQFTTEKQSSFFHSVTRKLIKE